MGKRALVGVVVIAAIAVVWRCSRGGEGGSSDRSTAASESANETNPRLRKPTPIATAARGSISGRVTSNGQPIADAEVCARVSSRELSSAVSRFPRCGRSGADGRYTVGDLVRGDYAMTASAPGHRPARRPTSESRERLALTDGQRVDGIDLELIGGAARVTGSVVDIGGGPIGGAWVYVRGDNWRGPSFTARTGDDGRFEAWVQPGEISVSARAVGYTRGRRGGVAPGQDLELVLTPESVITGVVVDVGSGDPVAGARVSADGSTAISDADGRFRIEGLDPGRYKPTATAIGRVGDAAESVLLGVGQTVDGVEIKVHPAFVVTATLLRPDDTPCDDGRVHLRETTTDHSVRGPAEAGGRVELRAVLPGTYRVNASCEGLPRGEKLAELTVEADVLDQKWKLENESAILVGRVIDGDGKPVEARIRVRSSGGDPRAQRSWGTAWAGVDGRFRIDGLLPGAVKITATSDRHLDPDDPTEVTLAAGRETPVEIELESGAVIEGSVRDERGKPQPGVRVFAVGKTGSSWSTSSESLDDGSFRIEGVLPGTVRVAASGRGWEPLRAPGKSDDDVSGLEIEVTAGGTNRADLVVESSDGEIRGKVVDARGEPVTDAFLTAIRQSERAGANRDRARSSTRWMGWNTRPSLTDTDGGFTIGDLRPGKYAVRAHRKGGGEGFATDVAVGSTITVTIPDTGSIAGTVIASGPVERFTVAVHDKASGFSRSERFFRTGGAWRLSDLPAGSFTVSASSHVGTAKSEVALADGERKAGVALALEPRTRLTGRVVALGTETPVSNAWIMVQPIKGLGRTRWRSSDRKNITDESGRFEIDDAAPGRVMVRAIPMGAGGGAREFGYGSKLVVLEPGTETDIGDIELPRRRLEAKERAGDLGFTTVDEPRDTDPAESKIEVALVKSGGPAAGSGLVAGDVITAIDGNDVTGIHRTRYWTLSRVKPGTAIKLTLARGETAEITAGPPR